MFKLQGKHKPKIYDRYTHKKEKGIQNNTKGSHQITKEENKRRRKEQKDLQNNPKTINKMAIRTYISIITLCKWIKCYNQKTQSG